MHVLMTADTVGGVWTYSLELARALSLRGVRVALATMGPLPTPQQRADTTRIPGLTLYPSEFKLEWMDDPWDDVERAGEWLIRLERRLHPDLVHLNGYAHGSLPWAAPLLAVAHSCCLSWWKAVKSSPPPEEWARYRREVTRGLRAAAMVAAPTRAMLLAADELYGPLSSTRVVPNGTCSDGYQPGVKEPLVLSAGRLWDEAKNVMALDAAAPDLPWPVYVAGDQENPCGGVQECANIHTLGRLAPPELRDWMSRAAIYALPARYEPFGLSALEAALSGCALVLGDIPSLREVWGDTALFVPPNDTLALVAAIRTLADDRALRDCYAARARARAAGYTPERMAEGYLNAYAELLGHAVEMDEEEPTCVS